MYQYRVWIRLNQYQTAERVLDANNDWECKQVAESYGWIVLNYSRIN